MHKSLIALVGAAGIGVAALPPLVVVCVGSFLVASETFAVGTAAGMAFATDDGEGGAWGRSGKLSAVWRPSDFAKLAVTSVESLPIAFGRFGVGASAGAAFATEDGERGALGRGCRSSAGRRSSGISDLESTDGLP